jgi:hypothetical protein
MSEFELQLTQLSKKDTSKDSSRDQTLSRLILLANQNSIKLTSLITRLEEVLSGKEQKNSLEML